MSSTALLAMLSGALVGVALILVALAFLPTTPHLGDTLTRLHRRPTANAPSAATRADRIGAWLQSRLPGREAPYADLDLLQITPARFTLTKVGYAAAGLLAPPVLLLIGTAAGVASTGWVVPTGLSLFLAATLWFLPNATVRRRARDARERDTRAVVPYVDLVALMRLSGAGMASSIFLPSTVAEAPLFVRIRESLLRQQLERRQPWEALRSLGDAIDLDPLREIADTIEMSGTKSTPIADSLKAKAADIRNQFLTQEVEQAGATLQRHLALVGCLLACILAFIAVPPVLQILSV